MAAVHAQHETIPLINRRETILGLILSFGFVALVAVALRLFARIKLARKPGWDDALVVLSMLSVHAGSIFLCLAAYSGLGRHFDTLTLEQTRIYLFRFYIANATYTVSTTLLKLSLLCQYLRIFEQGLMRTAVFVLLGICSVWGLISAIMAWAPCVPVAAYWDGSIANATCYAFGSKEEGPFVSTYVSHSAFNMVLDFAVIVLPTPILFRHAMSQREKFAAFGLGSLGLMVIAMCAWRLVEVVRHQAGFWPYKDFTWWSPIMVVLAALEVNIGIVAVSCPVFWPVVDEHIFGIVVHREVHVTLRPLTGFERFGDGDGQSEDGSKTALTMHIERAGKSRDQTYHATELVLEPPGLGRTDVSIRGRRHSSSSWSDAAP